MTTTPGLQNCIDWPDWPTDTLRVELNSFEQNLLLFRSRDFLCFFVNSVAGFVAYFYIMSEHYPPVSEASREVANLTERKNQNTPVYGVKESVCLSVTKFDPNYLRTDKTEWAEIFLRTSIAKSHVSKFCICLKISR